MLDGSVRLLGPLLEEECRGQAAVSPTGMLGTARQHCSRKVLCKGVLLRNTVEPATVEQVTTDLIN